MTLRLVGAPKPPKRRGQRRPNRLGVDVFSHEEGQRIRALIVNLRRTWGSYTKIAEAIEVCPESVKWVATGRRRPSPALAILVARLARVPLESVLSGLAVAS